MSSSTEIPQDRPVPQLPGHSMSGDKDRDNGLSGGRDAVNTGTVGGVGQQPPMQHELEVAQDILNLRQDSSKPTGAHPASADQLNNGDIRGANQQPNHQDPRSGGMHPSMPNMPPNIASADGRPPTSGMPHLSQMHGGPYMPNPYMMDPNGLNGGPMPPNGQGPMYMGENGPGPGFYPPAFHTHEADPYHHAAMMNGMPGEMYYGMMNPNDPNGMMAHPSAHFYPPAMMHPDSAGHFGHMMNNYPNSGFMQTKRPYSDEMGGLGYDAKRMRGAAGGAEKGQDTHRMDSKKGTEKHKKGKRSSDMPRRPLSAYNFFFSEERERILSNIPDPDETNETKEQIGDGKDKEEDDEKKVNEEKENKDDSEKEKQEVKPLTDAEKLSPEELKAKAAERSKRLLALRDNQSHKRRPHRKTHGKIGFKELVKQIGQRWKSLPASEKEYYTELAKTDLKRYKEQMSEYNNKHGTSHV